MKLSKRAFMKWIGIAAGMGSGLTAAGRAIASRVPALPESAQNRRALDSISAAIQSAHATVEPHPGVWLGLLNEVGERDEDHIEVSGPAYARQWIAPGAWRIETTERGGVVSTRASNLELIAFPEIPKDEPQGRGWGKVRGTGLYDAEIGGHLLFFATLAKPEPLFTRNQMYFEAGSFHVTLESEFELSVGQALLGIPFETMTFTTRDGEN